MATAVARRNSPRISRPNPRTVSPMDSKKTALKAEENSHKSSPLQSKASGTAPQSTSKADIKKSTQVTEPLAPPPRPAQAGENADYFSSVHSAGTQLSYEPNPFEQSFGDPTQETPGKTLLPPVASLTSPAAGANSTPGYNWGTSSLRSGPLSPAMLAGPAGSGDYFDGIRGFPTPNESSLRTGLTPGGGGSMFPAPSPGSQALLQAFQNGDATPGTVDFHRTAINAAARTKTQQFGSTSEAQDQNQQNMKTEKTSQDFASHDAEAANGLFMLAKGGQVNNQFAMQQQQQMAGNNQQDHRRNTASMGSLSGQDMGQQSDHEEAAKPNTRSGKGKKAGKAQAAGGRRKPDDTPSKPATKRSKGNSGAANVDPSLERQDYDDDDDSMEDEPTHDANGRKMTDEEKRKNFLERNRVAALKCRQRKKQWLANLQAKVELFSTENDALSGQVTQLREEIVSLKGLLLAHKDCPLGQAQGLQGMIINGLSNDVAGAYGAHHANPYGMAMQNGGGMQAGMQRS